MINKKINFASCILNNTEEIKVINKLDCIYDSRKSFYNKAYILKTNYNTIILQSYESFVCVIDNKDNIYINDNIDNELLYSNTTLRHIKEFIKQYSKHENKMNYKINDIKDFYNIYIKEV